MPCVFYDHSNIVFPCPFQGICNLLGVRNIDSIYRIVTDGTALLSCIHITSNTGPIRKDRIARVVRPNRIADADWIFSVPGGIEPLTANCCACILIVIRLIGIACRRRGNSTNEGA